jgi:hypothetical protein
MVKIKVSRTWALVDDGDFEWLCKWKWQLHTGGYAYRKHHLGIYENILDAVKARKKAELVYHG